MIIKAILKSIMKVRLCSVPPPLIPILLSKSYYMDVEKNQIITFLQILYNDGFSK